MSNNYGVYEKIIDIENLFKAYRKVRLCKRYRPVQQRYELNLESNIVRLQRSLVDPYRYLVKSYKKFTIHEPKTRQIAAPDFADRVVHQAIIRIIEPDIVKTFIPTTYACIKKRGTHKAVLELHELLKNKTTVDQSMFFLKTDIKSYFASVNHTVLKEIIRNHVSDKKLLTLLDKIINSYRDSFDTGIPIGNLTSQLFANMYLDVLDKFVVKNFLEKDLIYGYYRYMDDFILISNSKTNLINIRNEIQGFLNINLKLSLHPKKQLIQNTSFGIDFCGYNIFANKTVLRKSTIRRFVRRYKKRSKKIDRLQKALDTDLLPDYNTQLKNLIQSKKIDLDNSLMSHLGFVLYSDIDTSKEFLYVNNIRLPYMVNSSYGSRTSFIPENL